MKTIKKYQKGSEVKGSKGGKASQIIAGISAAAAGAAGIGKNISNRRKAKKAAEEKAKMEAAGKMKYGGAKKMKKYQGGGGTNRLEGPIPEFAAIEIEYNNNKYPIPSRRFTGTDPDFNFGKENTDKLRDPNYSFHHQASNEFYNDNQSLRNSNQKEFNKKMSDTKPGVLKEIEKRKAVANDKITMKPKAAVPIQKKGGATRKMQKGGPNVIQSMRRNMLNNKENRLIDRGVKNMKAGNVEKGRAQFEKSNDVAYKRRHLADKYKIGGMVNSNNKVTALKVAKGRTGGISSAPKVAIPKAQMGMGLKSSGVSRGKGKWMIDKPYERGSMGAGNSATKTTRSGDVKRTKTVTGGGMYPGSKGTITKTKTVGSDKSAWSKNPNQATGTVVKSKTKDISNKKANRIINRKAKMGGSMKKKSC